MKIREWFRILAKHLACLCAGDYGLDEDLRLTTVQCNIFLLAKVKKTKIKWS